MDINNAAAIVGAVIIFVEAVLARLRSLFPDFMPHSLTAGRRSFGVSVVPQVVSGRGTHNHSAPSRRSGLPIRRDFTQHFHPSPSVTFVTYPPPAYGSHTADRQYVGTTHGHGNMETSRGMSVAIVISSLPPAYTATQGEDDQSPGHSNA